jgi:hypothetical protein
MMNSRALTEIYHGNNYFLHYISKLANCYQKIIINNYLQQYNLIKSSTTSIRPYCLQDARTIAEAL